MGKTNKNNLSKPNKQFELLNSSAENIINMPFSENLKVNSETLMNWRNRIYNYQKKVTLIKSNEIFQNSILTESEDNYANEINPFSLEGLSLNFWRANLNIHDGPAMYFVIDTMHSSQIVLYIGETNSANKRWKGQHDCKNYIFNYQEALSQNNLSSHLDIRFFLDVPKEVKLRRKLEQKLIYLWLPPFNKETRSRWATTFTNN